PADLASEEENERERKRKTRKEMVASESSDFDEDLLNLACEVEAAQKQEEKGESPREAKRRRLDVSSPFKKPFAPHTGPNDDGRGQTQVAHRPSPRPSMVQHGLRQAGRNADRVTEHGNQRAAKSATPFQRSNSMRQSQLTPWTLSQSQASTGPSSASNGTRESTGIPSAQKDDELDDPELAAAIKASLEDLEKQSPAKAAPASNREDNVTLSTPSKGNRDSNIETQDGFDTDEIPDDFFTSPFQATPKHAMRPPLQSASQSLRLSPQKNLRQMTLFGAAAPPAEPSQTSRSPSKSLSSSQRRLERPTHHKLEKDFLSTWVYPLNLGRKRDYQFNITKKALFHNLLVALPTGLGKTFIAATVMLNWFRWTTDAQIVFVAPTKPLVSQQVHACFNIAGIPRSATTLLTGESAPGVRAEEWKNKRVFFMTPQTFVNDLKHGIADPKRIVLLVVDEAHRATGNYAYVEAVKFLERFNQSFRVLALTATPGRLVETVQEIIDGLNIARVEIRTEQSLDIREYVHSRSIEKYAFENSMEMTVCMDLFARALKPVVEKLTSQNAYWSRDPMALTPFGLTQARARWLQTAGRGANQGLKAMMNAVFTVLAGLAHSIDLLKYHGIRAFYRSMLEFKNSLKGGGGGKYRKMIHDSPSFQTLMVKLKDMTSNPDFTGNPKMDYLQQIRSKRQNGKPQDQNPTRVS
ncbi:3'-5' DNA helicase, partial [Ascosphaera atra]